MKTWLAVTLGFTCLVGLFIVPVIAASMREPMPPRDEMWSFIKERFYNHTIAVSWIIFVNEKLLRSN